jgi:predicted dehydrogenase
MRMVYAESTSATNVEPIRVGIAGLGRSGWNIHARTIQGFPGQFRVEAVVDPDANRRREASDTLGCRAYDDFGDLLRDDAVEVVVVATPNFRHTEHSVAALEAGKHVVCEKPFALTVADADRAIAAALRAGRLIVPFQNRRYEPHFQKVREVVESGVLGKILLVRLASHSFGRRWDWQTLLEYGAGALANNGPHMLDHAVHFLGSGAPEILCDLRNGLSSGDAEDHVKIVIKTADGPTVDMELTSCAALPQDRWLVMGTAGGLRGTATELHWRWVDWSTMPERPVDPAPTPDRSYNREPLQWQEETWQSPPQREGDNHAFYRDLFATLRQGQPPAITAESARRYVVILEHCRRVYAESQQAHQPRP